MNIAMFTDAFYPRVNGVAVSVKSYAEELASQNHRVIIVCSDYTKRKHIKERLFKSFFYDNKTVISPNVEILRIPADHLIFSEEDRAARLNQWHTIKKQLDIFKPDVVHINSEFVMGWYGLTYARHRHIANIFTFHTLWEDYIANYIPYIPHTASRMMGRSLVKFYLKRADEIIVPTQRIGDVVKTYGIEREYDILPTGIPESVTKINQKKVKDFNRKFYKSFPKFKDKKILLYVGRVVKEKNLDFLFDVFAEVKKQIPSTALLFVGGGPELEPLKRKAKATRYAKEIGFTGYKPRGDLAYYYNLADIFTFPSVTETQGLVTVESMLSGTPVVAIGEMGTLDVMQGDNGGFMVKKDVREFSDRVIQLLTDHELYKNKQKEAIEWGKKWSMTVLAPKLVRFYEKGIDNKRVEVCLNEKT